MSLDIQTPGEDRCLNPQTSPEVRLLGGPFTPILTRYDWRIVDVGGVGCHTLLHEGRFARFPFQQYTLRPQACDIAHRWKLSILRLGGMSFPSMEMHKFPVLAMLKVQCWSPIKKLSCCFSNYIDLYVYMCNYISCICAYTFIHGWYVICYFFFTNEC